MYTVPKEIDFPQFNMKCSGENVILCGIFHVCRMMFSILHFMFYRGNLDYFSESVNWYGHVLTHASDMVRWGWECTQLRAGHATTLPRQSDHVFRPEICCLLNNVYLRFGDFILDMRGHNMLHIFACHWCSTMLLLCRCCRDSRPIRLAGCAPFDLYLNTSAGSLLSVVRTQ